MHLIVLQMPEVYSKRVYCPLTSLDPGPNNVTVKLGQTSDNVNKLFLV